MCVRACHLSPLSQSADRVSERFSLYARSLEAEALHLTGGGCQRREQLAGAELGLSTR